MEDIILNPLNKLIKFFTEITVHEIIYTVLAIISIIVIYFSRSYFKKFNGLLHKTINTVEKFFTNKEVDEAIEAYNNHCEINKKIKEDIQKQLIALNDPNKQLTAMQYLYQYPSAVGYKAILEIAVKINDVDIRENLICNLCESLKANGWYDI